MYFDQKTFEKLHFNIIERLILMLSAGKSASTCAKTVWNELNAREKRIFFPLEDVFEVKNEKKSGETVIHPHFFYELKVILSSSSGVIEQMRSLRDILRVQNHLKHRTRQILQQTRVQALMAFLIYLFFCLLSVRFLGLELRSSTFLLSVTLFLCGQVWVLRLGGRVQWKT